jgi:hypothetical protein
LLASGARGWGPLIHLAPWFLGRGNDSRHRPNGGHRMFPDRCLSRKHERIGAIPHGIRYI